MCTHIITHIVNLSLNVKIVPIGWNVRSITPLFMDGDKTQASSYRPVAILPAISKVIERIVHNQVTAYFNEHNILLEAQFGFRKNHSTTTCTLSLLNEIYKNIDGGHLTGVVFLDLKKAFDLVDHGILLQKLSVCCIADNEMNWFSSYFDNRMKRAKVTGSLSRERRVKCGVPQGSILGPLLFIIYINDLTDFLTEAKAKLYHIMLNRCALRAGKS